MTLKLQLCHGASSNLGWQTDSQGTTSDEKGKTVNLPQLKLQKEKPMPKILPATFCTPDGRYAHIDGTRCPVLLAYHRKRNYRYSEDVSDEDEFPEVWTSRFRWDLSHVGKAVVAEYLTPHNWRCLGLHRVHDVQGGNLLTCRIGYRLAELKTTSWECESPDCSARYGPS